MRHRIRTLRYYLKATPDYRQMITATDRIECPNVVIATGSRLNFFAPWRQFTKKLSLRLSA